MSESDRCLLNLVLAKLSIGLGGFVDVDKTVKNKGWLGSTSGNKIA